MGQKGIFWSNLKLVHSQRQNQEPDRFLFGCRIRFRKQDPVPEAGSGSGLTQNLERDQVERIPMILGKSMSTGPVHRRSGTVQNVQMNRVF